MVRKSFTGVRLCSEHLSNSKTFFILFLDKSDGKFPIEFWSVPIVSGSRGEGVFVYTWRHALLSEEQKLNWEWQTGEILNATWSCQHADALSCHAIFRWRPEVMLTDCWHYGCDKYHVHKSHAEFLICYHQIKRGACRLRSSMKG